ncbi:MAG: cadherin-like domain-containing protein [Syntrophobacterales bacterium]|nr:cadherin-like domain-containing protein [Syntrophobacterales bacterium]
MQNEERNRKNGSQAWRLLKSRPCGLWCVLLACLFLLTMLAPPASQAADSVVKNGDFAISDPTNTDFGWLLSGAAYIDAGVLKLPEGGSTYSEASQEIIIPAGTSKLSFKLTKVKLEPNQENPPDAVVVYLEDPATKLALIESIESSAIFSYQQTGEVYYSPKVTVPGDSASGSTWTPTLPAQVLVDVSGITTTDVRVRVVFSLINYPDGASEVEIDNFQTMATPVANNDTASINEDSPSPIDIDVLANDTDLDGNATLAQDSVAVATLPAHGSAVVQSDGKIRYTPALNYWGADSFTYTVKDKDGHLSNTATVTVNVAAVNDSPVADAGPDQSIREGKAVTLDGSASADVDDVSLVYFWTQISGEAVTLSDSAAVKPTFTAPLVQAAGTLLTFQLEVTDAGNAKGTDTVSIQINNYVIPCDVNDNGVVDLADSVLLLRALTRLSNPDVSMTLAADVNGDGHLDSAELICTLQHAAGLRVVP